MRKRFSVDHAERWRLKPGSLMVGSEIRFLLFTVFFIVLLLIMATFYVLLVFVAMCSVLRLICVAPPHEASLRRSGIAHIVKGYHSFTCTPTRSSASGMSHTCLCLPSRSWYSFTDPEGWKAELTLVWSSPGWDSNLQPPDCKSSTLPHSHLRTLCGRQAIVCNNMLVHCGIILGSWI